jgi:hypothetical protein
LTLGKYDRLIAWEMSWKVLVIIDCDATTAARIDITSPGTSQPCGSVLKNGLLQAEGELLI